jgi:hypothetical protein
VSWAKLGFRDVIGPAEYPRAMKVSSSLIELDEGEREQVYAADWKQYENGFGGTRAESIRTHSSDGDQLSADLCMSERVACS